MTVNTELFENLRKIGVAVSGGRDSMALLHFLCAHFRGTEAELIAITVNHNLRAEGASDAEFVKEYCEKLGVECVLREIPAGYYKEEKGGSSENKARKKRYEIFSEMIASGRADAVATAHHAGDSVESALLHLFRGAGLAGFSPIRDRADIGGADGAKILRPLLCATRGEIDAYIEKHGVPCREDATNADSAYRRNFVRNELLPLVESKFPGAGKNIASFSALAAADEAFVASFVPEPERVSGGETKISGERFALPEAVFSRLILKSLAALGEDKDISADAVRAVMRLREKNAGKRLSLKKNVRAVRDYDGITILRMNGGAEEPDYFALIFPFVPRPALRADAEKIPAGAVWRTRRPGDRFQKFGGCTVSLKEYLIDQKLPARLRPFLPVLASGSDILCVLGFEIADAIKTDEKTSRVQEFLFSREFFDVVSAEVRSADDE